MEQLSLLPKVYEYGENLSSEEMNQIVQHLNSSIRAINYLLAKNNGINDGHCEMRYKVSAQQPEAPAAGSDGKSNGWSDTYTKPDTDNGEITWMTLCFLNGNGVYGAWSNPVCITWGSIEGQQGIPGETGMKGSFKSRVFKRQNTRPDIPTGGTYDNPIPSEGGWTDGIPQGNAIIWSSVCTFHGDGTSSGWSPPAPESDSATLDVEFSPLTIQPSAPIGNIPFANHESEGWYDSNSANFESAGIMIWRAERKVSNGEYSGDWTITRIYGEKGDKGDTGNDGGHHEFRYRNYIPSEQYPTPSKPATGSDGTTGGWSRTQQTLSETDIKNGSATWMTQCYVNDKGEYGEWTSPMRITGANGLDGEDGTIIEFVYTLKTSIWSNPTPPSTTQVDDWSGTGPDGTIWTDNPQGVNNTYMYEYVSQRSKINKVWTEYSSPAIWSKWGEKGMDGDGMQYVFKLFDTELNSTERSSTYKPTKVGITQTNGEWIPSGWNDDPPTVSSAHPYCYCSIIKKTNGIWGDFETLSLWAKYSKDGSDSTVPGPAGSGIALTLFRDNLYTDPSWDTYCEVGRTEPWGKRDWDPTNFTPCRIGDYFVVTGTSTDTGRQHTATFKCTAITSDTLTGTSISYVKTGNTGPMYYPAGIHSTNSEYTVTDKLVPVVCSSGDNPKYYYAKKNVPKNIPLSNNEYWEPFSMFKAAFIEVLFANWAKLGAFIVNGSWFISQHGKLGNNNDSTNYEAFDENLGMVDGGSNFIPHLAFNANTGELYSKKGTIGGFTINSKYLGNTQGDYYTYLAPDGYLAIKNPETGDHAHTNGALFISGGALIQGDGTHNVNISNTLGNTIIKGKPLYLNDSGEGSTYIGTGTIGQTIIGNSNNVLQVNAKSSTFTNKVTFNSTLDVQGILTQSKSIKFNPSNNFSLPLDSEKGQMYFCKGTTNDFIISIPANHKVYNQNDGNYTAGPDTLSVGKLSTILVCVNKTANSTEWVRFYCG